jgi:hypothetical protein
MPVYICPPMTFSRSVTFQENLLCLSAYKHINLMINGKRRIVEGE